MNISIIIPTYNRLASLKRVLEGLENQTLAPTNFEVVVVSDGATDGTDEFLANLQTPLTLNPVFQVNAGAAAARNAGIQTAVGDLVVFLDDDVVPAPQLLAEHLRTHAAEGDNVVVLGPMITPADFVMAPWVQWEQAMLVKQYTAMTHGDWEPTARQFYTGNTSLRRSYLLASGGFDAQFKRAEDVELAYRLADSGLRFVFNAEAIGYHYAERSFTSWMNIAYAYGRNDVIFAQEKGQTWLLTAVWREYRQRNVLIRAITSIGLGRPFISQLILKLLEITALAGYKLGLKTLAGQAFSGIFNLRYYQGTADQLGSRAAFFAGLNAPNTVAPDQSGNDTSRPPAQTSMVDR